MSTTRIEMRNGKKVKVTESTGAMGTKAEYVEPIEEGVQNEAIHNLPLDPDTGLPIQRFNYEQEEADHLEPLPTPVMNFGQEQPHIDYDSEGLPTLPCPTIANLCKKQRQTGKAKQIDQQGNKPVVNVEVTDDDGDDLPVLPTPGMF